MFPNPRSMSVSPRMPTSQNLLESHHRDEQILDTCALEFYEKWNRAWRMHYTNPRLARQSIGSEFLSGNRRTLRRLPQTGNIVDIRQVSSQSKMPSLRSCSQSNYTLSPLKDESN